MQIPTVDDPGAISLTAGSANVRIRNLEPGDHFEISTPAATSRYWSPAVIGWMLMTATCAPTSPFGTEVPKWAGRRARKTLREQESAELAAGVEPSIEGVTAGSIDSLDLWAQDRDRREEQPRAAEYVSRYGWLSGLDGYGQWVAEPTYGTVWVPVVAANWAPYHYGY